MTAARSDLMALDPLEMLLDAARFADSIKPEWAKAARKAVAAARLAASQPDREVLATAVRGALVENWKDDFGAAWNEDVLLTGCRRVGGGRGYQKPEEAAQNLALDAADKILSLLSGASSGADTKSDGGRIYTIEHDGFVGSMQGSYITREGKRGVVLQQIGTRVVHVYGEKWLKTPDVKPAPIADSSEAGRGIDAAAKFLAEKVTGFQWDGIRNDGRSGDAGFPPFGHYTNARQEDYRDVVREIARLAALSAPVGEPVAWRLTWPDGRHSFYSTKPPNFYECKPLYAALTRPLGGFVQGSIADGGQCNEQSGKQPSLRTSPELLAALGRAKAHVMTPAERYEQRRSFTRGMCPSNRDYAEWCAEVDKLLPPLPAVAETDADAQRDDGLLSGATSDPINP